MLTEVVVSYRVAVIRVFLPLPPSLQEDATAASQPSDGIGLPDDVANRMSLFYANPTPMLHTLSGAAEKLLQGVCVIFFS